MSVEGEFKQVMPFWWEFAIGQKTLIGMGTAPRHRGNPTVVQALSS